MDLQTFVVSSCLLTPAWPRLPARLGDCVRQLSATDSLHRDCQSAILEPSRMVGVEGGGQNGKWREGGGSMPSVNEPCVSVEEPAFI